MLTTIVLAAVLQSPYHDVRDVSPGSTVVVSSSFPAPAESAWVRVSDPRSGLVVGRLYRFCPDAGPHRVACARAATATSFKGAAHEVAEMVGPGWLQRLEADPVGTSGDEVWPRAAVTATGLRGVTVEVDVTNAPAEILVVDSCFDCDFVVKGSANLVTVMIDRAAVMSKSSGGNRYWLKGVASQGCVVRANATVGFELVYGSYSGNSVLSDSGDEYSAGRTQPGRIVSYASGVAGLRRFPVQRWGVARSYADDGSSGNAFFGTASGYTFGCVVGGGSRNTTNLAGVWIEDRSHWSQPWMAGKKPVGNVVLPP